LKPPAVSAIVFATERDVARRRYAKLLGSRPLAEFPMPGRPLWVTVFPGLSVVSGSLDALATVRDLRATISVASLQAAEEVLRGSGWTEEGTLNPSASRLARDSDGNLLELVDDSAPLPRGPNARSPNPAPASPGPRAQRADRGRRR
jgi:hypothetical protein